MEDMVILLYRIRGCGVRGNLSRKSAELLRLVLAPSGPMIIPARLEYLLKHCANVCKHLYQGRGHKQV